MALAVLAQPAFAEDKDRPKATAIIEIRAESPTPVWLARALKETFDREIGGSGRLTIVEVQPADCPDDDLRCRLQSFQASADYVVVGNLSPSGLTYMLGENPNSRVVASESNVALDGQIKHVRREILRIFHPILTVGGLLDMRPFLTKEQEVEAPTDSAKLANFVVMLSYAFAGLFLLPFLLVLPRLKGKKLRSLRLALPLLALFGFVSLCSFNDWLLAPIASLLQGSDFGGASWLVGILGGGAWGWFVLIVFRLITPSIGGLERISHSDISWMVKAWLLACLTRLLLIAVFYAPFGIALAMVLDTTNERLIWMLGVPLIGLILRFWFLCVVECLAVDLDRRLVEGPANKENPWHRDISKYFEGYLARTGLDLDPRLLEQVVFLPAPLNGAITYGGGLTYPRILIGTKHLGLAIGELEEIPSETRLVPWNDAQNGHFAPGDPIQDVKSSGWSPKRWFGQLVAKKDAKEEPKPQTKSRKKRRRMIGQAANSLGFTTPTPADDLVPLMADDAEDFKVVRELLAEHFGWYEAYSHDEVDDTDPTDYDFLFGLLVREIGVIRREDSQILTLFRWVQFVAYKLIYREIAVNAGLNSAIRHLSILADGFSALNQARNHLIQYLFFIGWRRADLLTARADDPKLRKASEEIFKLIKGDTLVSRKAVRSRLVWLARFFGTGLKEQRSVWSRIALVVALVTFVIGGGYYLVDEAISYHPIYLQRMAEQGVVIPAGEGSAVEATPAPTTPDVQAPGAAQPSKAPGAAQQTTTPGDAQKSEKPGDAQQAKAPGAAQQTTTPSDAQKSQTSGDAQKSKDSRRREAKKEKRRNVHKR